MTKPLRVFIRKQGNHFRVVYQRHYPNGVLEEVMLTQRFETEAEAQSYADDGLRAQHIYRALTQHRSPARPPLGRVALSRCFPAHAASGQYAPTTHPNLV